MEEEQADSEGGLEPVKHLEVLGVAQCEQVDAQASGEAQRRQEPLGTQQGRQRGWERWVVVQEDGGGCGQWSCSS